MSGLDMQQARQALKGPGMDTRYWVRLVKVTKVETDKHGTIITADTMPGGEEISAKVAHLALGTGKGAYWPVRVDDIMLCMIADGDPGIANIAIGPLVWGETELTTDAQSGPAETWYEGDPVKIKNDVSIEGNVKLGSLTASDPVTKHTELKDSWGDGNAVTGLKLSKVIDNIETYLVNLGGYTKTGIKGIDNAASDEVKVK